MITTTIPDEAFNLIVTEEDSGQVYYTKHYQHFEWPGGASGPTVGIGYDCGYSTAMQIRFDWATFVSNDTIDALARAAGLKGQAGRSFVAAHAGSVTITWDQAIAQFRTREVPKWIKNVQAVLPNTDELPPLCLGALVSLSYNRGCGGYHSLDPHFAEMHAIFNAMVAKEFAKIPSQIIAMRRLWPAAGDLWRRREHEAALFQKGLAADPATAAKAA